MICTMVGKLVGAARNAVTVLKELVWEVLEMVQR